MKKTKKRIIDPLIYERKMDAVIEECLFRVCLLVAIRTKEIREAQTSRSLTANDFQQIVQSERYRVVRALEELRKTP